MPTCSAPDDETDVFDFVAWFAIIINDEIRDRCINEVIQDAVIRKIRIYRCNNATARHLGGLGPAVPSKLQMVVKSGHTRRALVSSDD